MWSATHTLDDGTAILLHIYVVTKCVLLQLLEYSIFTSCKFEGYLKDISVQIVEE
jgi:hypothetical protein